MTLRVTRGPVSLTLASVSRPVLALVLSGVRAKLPGSSMLRTDARRVQTIGTAWVGAEGNGDLDIGGDEER